MPELTRQESRVMRLLIQGARNKTVAAQLGISLRTLEHRRQSLMRKLEAESPVQLGYLFAQHEARSE